ncbi:MAG: hypothetical protein OEZ59_13050 [Deltaproteobacteria bacterium]|nr:hypothetical protein [Deltaproteobacteria bacterium]
MKLNDMTDTLITYTFKNKDSHERDEFRDWLIESLGAIKVDESTYLIKDKEPAEVERLVQQYFRKPGNKPNNPFTVNAGWYKGPYRIMPPPKKSANFSDIIEKAVGKL